MNPSTELIVTREGSVALIEMRRAPHNFLDMAYLRELADLLDELDAEEDCRAVVIHSGLKAFSAGADFSGIGNSDEPYDPSPIYAEAMRLFRSRKPIVAWLTLWPPSPPLRNPPKARSGNLTLRPNSVTTEP